MKKASKFTREDIFDIIEKSDGDNPLSTLYDYVMIAVIAISLIPLAFKTDYTALKIIDKVTVAIFILDYFFRWITADYKLEKKAPSSFIKYPFTPMAIVDLLSILPSLSIVNNSFKVLRVLRMIRAMRVVRVFKAMRYSRSFEIIGNVVRSSRDSLIAVSALAVGYILLSAFIIFNVEPDSFRNFFDAVYWATISLTTVGYGDIYPVTTIGRVITMFSSMFGIAIVALPAGIITAGYMNEINRKEKEEEEEREKETDYGSK